jgi:hypothetical protein
MSTVRGIPEKIGVEGHCKLKTLWERSVRLGCRMFALKRSED